METPSIGQRPMPDTSRVVDREDCLAVGKRNFRDKSRVIGDEGGGQSSKDALALPRGTGDKKSGTINTLSLQS